MVSKSIIRITPMINKVISIIFLVLLVSSCGNRSIPILENGTTQLISNEAYEDFIVEKLEATIKETNRHEDTTELYLKYITYGFSLDVRVGLFGWNLATSSSIEFHMLPQKTSEEAL